MDNILNTIPKRLKRLTISTIHSTNKDTFILGKVSKTLPIIRYEKYGSTHMRFYLVLINNDGSEDTNSIQIFLNKGNAHKAAQLKLGDFVAISGYEIIKNLEDDEPEQDCHPFFIYLMDDSSKIWITSSKAAPITRNLRSSTKSPNKPSASKKRVFQFTDSENTSSESNSLLAGKLVRGIEAPQKRDFHKSFEKEPDESPPKRLARNVDNQTITTPSTLPISQTSTESAIIDSNFSTILDILTSKASQMQYNLYAVVLLCKVKTITGSNTKQLQLMLIDSSCPRFLECIVLAKKDEKFPPISQNDIIRICFLEPRGNEPNGVAKCSSPNSIAVFDNNTLEPSSCVQITDTDRENINKLKSWYVHDAFNYYKTKIQEDKKTGYKEKFYVMGGIKEYSSQLSEINSYGYPNIICQLLGIIKIEENCLLFQVWDGTKSQACSGSHYQGSYMEARFANFLSASIEAYTVDVWIYDNHVESCKLLNPGDLVFLQNVHFYVPNKMKNPGFYLHKDGIKFNRGVKRMAVNDILARTLNSRLDHIREEILSTQEEPENGCDLQQISTIGVEELSPMKLIRVPEPKMSPAVESLLPVSNPIDSQETLSDTPTLISEIVGHNEHVKSRLIDVIQSHFPSTHYVRSLVTLCWPFPDKARDAINMFCPTCYFTIAFEEWQEIQNSEEVDEVKPCPKCFQKKQTTWLQLVFILRFVLWDKHDLKVEVIAWAEEAEKLLNLTPKEAFDNHRQFVDLLLKLADNNIQMDLCLKRNLSCDLKTIRHYLFDTKLLL